MACNKVPIRNVSFSKSPIATDISIQEVLADSSTIKAYNNNRNISLTDYFKSPNINKDYIDPNWCAGSTPTQRFNELSIEDPIQSYDFIQYGGCEDNYPEIYFSAIYDSYENNVPLNLDSGLPLIYLGTHTSILNSAYKDIPRTSPDEENVQGSPLYYRTSAEEFLNKHILNVKVGLDQGIVVYNNVQYKIKITGELGLDYLVKNKVYYEAHKSDITLFSSLAGTSSVTISADNLGAWLLDKPGGPFTKVIGDFAEDILVKIGGAALLELTTLLGIAVLYAGFMDFLVDIGVNADTLKYPLGGWHHYDDVTGGMYSTFDVRDSGLKYSVGKLNKHEFDIDNSWSVKNGAFNTPVYNFDLPYYETVIGALPITFELNNITILDGKYYNYNGNNGSIKVLFNPDYAQTYRIRYKVVNSNGLGSVTDDAEYNGYLIGGARIIDLPLPNGSGNVEIRVKAYVQTSQFNIIIDSDFEGYIDDISVHVFYDESPGIKDLPVSGYVPNIEAGYHVLEFEPRGRNFDRTIPPPPTVYICELVPVNNCKLSETKVTKFLAVAAPDKYVKPDFDVIPKPNLNYGSLVKFQDAKYSDFLAFKDLEKTSLSGHYHHFVVNTLGNYTVPDRFVPLRGKDIIEKVEDIFSNHDGKYQVIFAKAVGVEYSQQVFNRHFIDRNDSYNDNRLAPLYWVHDGNWKFEGGAVYMTSAGNPIRQQLHHLTRSVTSGFNVNYHKLYLIQIEVVNMTSGYACIEADGTFEYNLYKKYNEPLIGGVNSEILNNLPDNVSIVGTQIRLNANGFYNLILKTRNTTFNDNRIKLNGGSGFNGGFSYCTVRRLPYEAALSKLAALATFDLNISKTHIPNIMKLYYKPTTFNGGTYDFLEIVLGKFPHTTNVTIYWGDGAYNSNNVLANSTQSFNHNYDITKEGQEFIISIHITNAAYIPYIKIENTNFFYLEDPASVLYDSEVIFANCGLKATIPFGSNTIKSVLSQFYRLSELDLSNNPISDNLFDLGNVSKYINFSNTNITGDLSELSGTSDYININNSNINQYSSLPDLHCKVIYWQNTKGTIDVDDLNHLIRDLYNSSINDGELYIAGSNPKITDEQILWYIFQLVHFKHWIVVYNGYYITTANQENYLQGSTDDYIYTHNS